MLYLLSYDHHVTLSVCHARHRSTPSSRTEVRSHRRYELEVTGRRSHPTYCRQTWLASRSHDPIRLAQSSSDIPSSSIRSCAKTGTSKVPPAAYRATTSESSAQTWQEFRFIFHISERFIGIRSAALSERCTSDARSDHMHWIATGAIAWSNAVV